jgi:chromosome partitioning protein
MSATVISIFNRKGGVGKTTLSIHLASTLATMSNRLKKYKVLIVDGDTQANTTSFLLGEKFTKNIKKKNSLTAIFEAYELNQEFSNWDEVILKNSPKDKIIFPDCKKDNFDNLHLIASEEYLEEIEMKIHSKPPKSNDSAEEIDLKKTSIFSRAIDKIKNNYDFIFLDCRPSYDIITKNLIYSSDFIIVPLNPDWMSIKLGLTRIIRDIGNLNKQFKKDIQIKAVVPTTFNANSKILKLYDIKEIQNILDNRIISKKKSSSTVKKPDVILNTIVWDKLEQSEIVVQSQRESLPIIEKSANSSVTELFKKWARVIITWRK